MRNRDPHLAYAKVNFFFHPLRKELRSQAIERALKFQTEPARSNGQV
jgi:hypothetical protein